MKKVSINEWQTLEIPNVDLLNEQVRAIVNTLNTCGIVEITELKNGVRITSNSYVGKIVVGDLDITVNPKINGLPLYTLLKYAYGLGELKLFDNAEHSLETFSFFDLLIYQLMSEAEKIYKRGIGKSYIRKSEPLSSPRGKIDIKELSKVGTQTCALPCTYFDRSENIVINQIVLAGLKLGIRLVTDNGLKRDLQILSQSFEESIDAIVLNRDTLQKAKNSLNRLMVRYEPILEIINMLFESQGIQLEDKEKIINLNGYFFDMNSLFETLISRLLAEFCTTYSVRDQHSLSGMFVYTPGFNPKRKKSPTPRPDFALIKDAKVVKLLDAKYRDLWEYTLPREMLYQLAIYAVSGVGNNTATILYPATSDLPTAQKIDVFNPVGGGKLAEVALKPVNLNKVAQLLSQNETELNNMMNCLVI